MADYLLSLDQGTTSSRAIIFDRSGIPVAKAQTEFAQIFPSPGLVEHDAKEIWATQLTVAQEVLSIAGLKATEVSAIGITNQRETTVIWAGDVSPDGGYSQLRMVGDSAGVQLYAQAFTPQASGGK